MCASDRAVGVTIHVATSDLAGPFALYDARSQVVASNHTVWPNANCAFVGIVARVVAIGAALSRARGYVVTFQCAVVTTELAAVFGIVARCYALIAADCSARIGLGTLQIASVGIALQVAVRCGSTGAVLARRAPGPGMRLAASDSGRDPTQGERSNQQAS